MPGGCRELTTFGQSELLELHAMTAAYPGGSLRVWVEGQRCGAGDGFLRVNALKVSG
jgi:hypothetical protein